MHGSCTPETFVRNLASETATIRAYVTPNAYRDLRGLHVNTHPEADTKLDDEQEEEAQLRWLQSVVSTFMWRPPSVRLRVAAVGQHVRHVMWPLAVAATALPPNEQYSDVSEMDEKPSS